MIIIALDDSNPTSYWYYVYLDTIFYFLAEYLPKQFLNNINYNGEILQIPKYITKLHYDGLDNQTRDLLRELAENTGIKTIKI